MDRPGIRARRRPLPMFLGLAVFTVAAHTLVAVLHAFVWMTRGASLITAANILLVLLVGAAPVAAGRWMLRDAPRPGAALMASTLAVGGAALFLLHYVWVTPAHVAARSLSWLDTAYMGTAYFLLTFEMLGVASAIMLVRHPVRRLNFAAA